MIPQVPMSPSPPLPVHGTVGRFEGLKRRSDRLCTVMEMITAMGDAQGRIKDREALPGGTAGHGLGTPRRSLFASPETSIQIRVLTFD